MMAETALVGPPVAASISPIRMAEREENGR